MENILKGKTVVIAGGSGPVGQAITARFHDQGAICFSTSRQVESESGFREIGEKQYRLGMDPGHYESINQAISAVVDHFERLDVWIQVIGGFQSDGLVENTDIADWQRMLDLNFFTALRATQAVLPQFKNQGSGRLILFGAAAALDGMAKTGPYIISKAAVHALIRTTAKELSGDITCNAILPSTIDTPANRSAMPSADFSNWISPDSIAEAIQDLLLSSKNGQLVELQANQ